MLENTWAMLLDFIKNSAGLSLPVPDIISLAAKNYNIPGGAASTLVVSIMSHYNGLRSPDGVKSNRYDVLSFLGRYVRQW